MPSFIETEMEKANVKFINLVKKYPCIWNKDAPNYNLKSQMDKAWEEIAEEMDDTPRICLTHWQKLRRAYARSCRINSDGSYQKSEYYMASALEFIRPYIHPGCTLKRASYKKDEATKDTDDSPTTTTTYEISIKDEPDDPDGFSAPAEDDEYVLLNIIKMEDDNDDDETSDIKETQKSPCNKRKKEDDSSESGKSKEAKDANKDVHPNLCLIDANRKFFESLIPFIDDMNNTQNRRFRREIMCLIDDVLDDRDIDVGGGNGSS